jgi:hypothetical protein
MRRCSVRTREKLLESERQRGIQPKTKFTRANFRFFREFQDKQVGGIMKTVSIRVIGILLVALSCSAARSQNVAVGSPQIVLAPSSRPDGLLNFPDGTLGVKLIGGTYYVFSDSWMIPSVGHSGVQGVSSPDINNLANNFTERTPSTNISLGSAGQFDSGYVGGGPMYYDAADGILIMMYHGEYWYGNYDPFLSGLGLAVSRDLGATWTKLGAVILANTPHSGCGNPASLDMGSGGMDVRADGFTYAYFVDTANQCENGNIYTGVARANTAALIAAALAGGPPSGSLFQKYSGGSFSQPGVMDITNHSLGGGSSDNISPAFLMYLPSVKWNAYIGKYVASYMVPWTGISIAFSTDGLTWTNPTTVVTGGVQPGGANAYLYGTLINTAGGDPDVLGSSFWMYYVDQQYNDWSSTNLDRVQITVTSAGAAKPNPPGILKASAH